MQAIKENKDKEQQSKNKKIMDIIREKLIITNYSQKLFTNYYIQYLFLYLIPNTIYNFSKRFYLSIV